MVLALCKHRCRACKITTITNRKQTESKQKANRKQTESKQKANRKQTETIKKA